MEELKKAEVALFASGHEPDYAQNECVLTLIHFHKTNHLFFFLSIKVNLIILNGKQKKSSRNVF